MPKTIEEATRRYLYHYENGYNGSAAELYRLKGYTIAFIHQLRKVAPKFYEEKLPTLLNQAASTLLTFNTNTEEGTHKFHETHAHFLKILQELQKSQPAGEVNFHDERIRMQERYKLFNRQLELRRRIDELEATEFDNDDIGGEDEETKYTKTMKELDALKAEAKRVSLEVAFIEGELIEEEAKFELRVTKNSVLSRLTPEQLKHLESQMLEFYKEKNKQRTAIYVDKSIVDGMIEKLNIDQNLFTKEELRELSKNALDAYKSYYREIDLERRTQYFDELLRNKHLLPKEGKIFSSPDDVPEEVKQKLDENDKKYKRKIEDLFEEFSKRPCVEESQADSIEDDEVVDDTPKILEAIKQRGIQFARVKEEPRDDFDESDPASSGNEMVVSGDTAESLVDGETISYSNEARTNDKIAMTCHIEQVSSDEQQANDTDDDDDIECLGTIEPGDKIKTVYVD